MNTITYKTPSSMIKKLRVDEEQIFERKPKVE